VPTVSPAPVVLLVDDDAAVAHALKFSLELEGFEVRTFAAGESLLAADDLPERGCVVIDMNLPGADGLEVVRRLRERRVALPAVLITTAPTPTLRDRARRASVPIVEKPLLGDALPDQVRRVLTA